jgi:ribosomal protein S18 acetylase RimI-like enzyme
MQLRDMTPEDLDQVMVMEERLVKPWKRYSFGQAVRLGHRVAVVEKDGKILGYGIADGGHGRHICASHPEAALMLYRRWKQEAIEKGIDVLWAETHKDSVESIAMLMRFGFTKQGTRPNYFGPGEDATVWARPNLTEALIGSQGRSPLQVSEPV